MALKDLSSLCHISNVTQQASLYPRTLRHSANCIVLLLYVTHSAVSPLLY